jgi:hypothetical protein
LEIDNIIAPFFDSPIFWIQLGAFRQIKERHKLIIVARIETLCAFAPVAITDGAWYPTAASSTEEAAASPWKRNRFLPCLPFSLILLISVGGKDLFIITVIYYICVLWLKIGNITSI